MACSECGERLYRCANCKYKGHWDVDNYCGGTDTYEWCFKFDQSTYKVRTALGKKVRCPVWELPQDVNFCKTCGRLLRENK